MSSSRGSLATSEKPKGAGSSGRAPCTGTFPLRPPDPTSSSTRRTSRAARSRRFAFVRQAGGEHLSLADYLREPEAGGGRDVVALQVVTIGSGASERVDALQAASDYSESYFLHGFSVQAAEATAEYVHRRIRAELGLPGDRGKRYSWGYGACPDLSQHAIVWQLLDVERSLGVKLTEAFQMVPEQSTAAIVIHHPEASYFNAAAVRELIGT